MELRDAAEEYFGVFPLPFPSVAQPPSLPRGLGDATGEPEKDFQFIEPQEIILYLNNRFQRTEEEAGYSALGRDKASLNQGKEGKEEKAEKLAGL